MSFYKGYVPTKNKKCQMKFANVDPSDLYSYDEIKGYDEFAGIIAEDSILVDVDDKKQSEILFDICEGEGVRCRILESRSGMHFLFKNSQVKKCYTKTKVACGLTLDIKSGFKNSYEVLKVDGKERELLYEILEDEDYEEIPKWLFPIKSSVEFLNMQSGDGRNDALFKYILTLQQNDYSVDECKEVLRIINTYVLKEPLPEKELEVILRKDAFLKPIFYKGNKLQHHLFGNFLISEHNIIRINGQLHIFKDGVYVSGQDQIEAAMIQHIDSISNSQRQEVFKYLHLKKLQNTPVAPPHYIAFRNGIYDLLTDTLQPFRSDIVITNKIPWDYNPAAYSELADKTLDKISCHDGQLRALLEECIGSCLYRSNTLGGGKAFLLTGEKGNGKSTYIDMIQHVLGEDNISALDLKDLGAKFQNAALFGRLANLGDDISDEFITDTSIFKKFVTGERVQVQNKGEKPFEFNNYAKLIFSANTIPRIKDKTGAVLRRLLIIPFDAKFSKDDPDYDSAIKFKLHEQTVMEYVIAIGIRALKNVIENQGYTYSDKVISELEQYNRTNNPIVEFIEEVEEKNQHFENEPTIELFKSYEYFCSVNGYKAVRRAEFTSQVKRLKGLDTKQVRIKKGENPVWVFVKKGDA